jgi:ribonuclease VapC
MVVDTSAVLAVLFAEEDRELYIKALAGKDRKFMTPLNALEADIVVQARKGEEGHNILERFFYNTEIDVLPFDQTMRKLAFEAWLKFGKGRNPASLNMGDCCAYALSVYLKEPLLYKGNDFSRTDVLSFL